MGEGKVNTNDYTENELRVGCQSSECECGLSTNYKWKEWIIRLPIATVMVWWGGNESTVSSSKEVKKYLGREYTVMS